MTIRPAQSDDAPGMVAVLNRIIALGGTTAHQTPYDEARMLSHYIAPSRLVSCHVAVAGDDVLGFQFLGWADKTEMPEGWAIIASFVDGSAAGQGIGQHLFAATKTAAKDAGVVTIDATIRADNLPGLRYYSGLGFQDYGLQPAVPLRDGTKVDRVQKRFDL